MTDRLTQRPLLWVALAFLIVVLLAGALITVSSVRASRITGQQTVVVAPDQLVPGRETVMRAVVLDFDSGRPLPGANVEAYLRVPGNSEEVKVFHGLTDETGSVPVLFVVPKDQVGDLQVVIRSYSEVGSDELVKTVRVERSYKLLLTTDKPLYQPGQIIHVRSLALSAGDLTAADGEPVEFVIEDPKGNKVFRQTVTTSPYGIASVDFRLANEVNTGPYKVVARLGNTESEKTVTVKPYVLPKFSIEIATDRPWYLPGQQVKGSLRAEYFFGKPVSGAQVTIVGSVYEIERRQVLELTGTTDAEGRFEFQFDLPTYFVSGAPEVGQAAFGLEVTVIDQAQHAEQVAETLLVAEQPLLIDVVAESGVLKPGVENIIYILTSYPNGAPARTTLDITAGDVHQTLTTGSAGLAEFRFTPEFEKVPVLTVRARDDQGNQVQRRVELDSEYSEEVVLLRPERAAYRVGETLRVDVLASQPSGTVYLDVIREGQTLSTRALEIVNGRATAEIDLDETMFGTLELHAYKVLRDASLVADTRLVVVDRAEGIDVEIAADKDTYRPGDPATISFRTTQNGQPLPAALGLSIVDESVFALQEQEAGLAKLYFLLQAEILKPRYQLKGFTPGLLTTLPEQPEELRAAGDTVAQAALAANPLPEPEPLRLDRWAKRRAIKEERAALFRPWAEGLTWLLMLLGVVALILSLAALVRRRELGRGLLWALAGLFALSVAVGLLLMAALSAANETGVVLLLAAAGLALLIGLVGLAVHAWRNQDQPLQLLIMLAVGFALLLPLQILAASKAFPDQQEAVISVILRLGLGLLALVLALYLRGAGFAGVGQRRPAAFGFLAGLGVPLLVGLASFGMFTLFGGGFLGAAAPLPVPAAPAAIMEEAIPVEKVVEETVAAVPAEEKAATAGQEPPRLRQFFPETLYWNPQVITDQDGRATVTLDTVADSITTWRLSVLASSQQGDLGSATAGLRVFQDFFVDLDLPLYLTQNDEVSLPVAVFNYLPQAQEVRLVVEPAEWFELLDEPEKTLTIAANDVEVVYFRIRAAKFGRQRFQVTAWGEKLSDAIVREVEVLPDGKRFRETTSDRLEAGETVLNLAVPPAAVPGTARVYVKIYPGVVSQVVEGLQGMLRMPFG